MTVFAPTQSAMEALPEETLRDLRGDRAALREFLLFHVATPRTCKCDFEDGKMLVRVEANVIDTIKTICCI